MNSVKINIAVILFILLFQCSILNAEYVYQNNWSEGAGVTGPVTDWGECFSTQSNTSWTSLPPARLLLGMSTIIHTINSSMFGCNFAFPADMDSDGDMDVLAQSTGIYWDVIWFENDGSGGGWDIHMVSDDYPEILCAYPGDLDCDGDVDVAGANSYSSGIEWWRNEDGVGDSWTRFFIDDQYGYPSFVCCADITNDNTLEVVSPSPPPIIEIAWWESSTTPPDSIWDKHVVSDFTIDALELFPVDLDLDGDIDILCAAEFDFGLSFFENTDGLGLSWSQHIIGDYYSRAHSTHASDIDGDGDYDVVYCNSDYEEVSWFENLDGSCTNWEEHTLESHYEWPRGVHAADVTDDGFVDILVADSEAKKLLLNMNIGGTGMVWAVHVLNSTLSFEDVDVADFNGDGFIDILAAATVISWHEICGYSSGWLESSILDMGGYPEWDSIAWTAEEPAGTDLFFQIKSSNDCENMGVWCDTIFESVSLAGFIDSTHRYIQYRVGMTTENRFGTPVLDEVRFYWSSMGIEGSEDAQEFVLSTVPNPSIGGVSIAVPSFYAEDVELLVYDIAGKLIFELTESDGSVFHWDGCDSSGNELPAGTYVVRGVLDNRSDSVKFVKL